MQLRRTLLITVDTDENISKDSINIFLDDLMSGVMEGFDNTLKSLKDRPIRDLITIDFDISK